MHPVGDGYDQFQSSLRSQEATQCSPSSKARQHGGSTRLYFFVIGPFEVRTRHAETTLVMSISSIKKFSFYCRSISRTMRKRERERKATTAQLTSMYDCRHCSASLPVIPRYLWASGYAGQFPRYRQTIGSTEASAFPPGDATGNRHDPKNKTRTRNTDKRANVRSAGRD